MGLKVCKGCHKTFKAQFTDEQLLALYYEPELIEKVSFLKAEYPGMYNFDLSVPQQFLCATCIKDPTVVVVTTLFGGISVTKIVPEKKEGKQTDQKNHGKSKPKS